MCSILGLAARHLKGDEVKDKGEMIVVDKLQLYIKDAWPNTQAVLVDHDLIFG
jgi:hypothetical protein